MTSDYEIPSSCSDLVTIYTFRCIECSAKTGENIDKVFDMAGRAAISHKKDKDKKHCILM